MFNFKDLEIEPKENKFSGKKIEVEDILDEEIIVHDFEIKDSIAIIGTKYLTLQIELEKKKKVVFTSGKFLMDVIQQIPTDKFPFTTTIKKTDRRLDFT